MDIKSQLVFVVINMFLSKSCIVCEVCQCKGLINILKSTMLMEIFDLKMQNGMLQARMDKLESMLQGKSSSTPTQDISRPDALEERLDSVESNMQQAIVISKKALKLNAIISKALQSEKKERIRLETKTESQIHHLNGSVTDLKFTITNALKDNLTKIGDDMEKMEHQMKDSVMDVRKYIECPELPVVENRFRNIFESVSEITCNTVGCYRAGAAYMYKGTRRTTQDGISCQWWNSQSPHKHHMKEASRYPDSSVAAAQNYCRDPDRAGAPWCYTTDSNKRWDYCGVKKC